MLEGVIEGMFLGVIEIEGMFLGRVDIDGIVGGVYFGFLLKGSDRVKVVLDM